MPFKKGHKSGMSDKKHSEETKRKMRESHRKNDGPWNKGKTKVYSEETLKSMSNSAKGKKSWIKD